PGTEREVRYRPDAIQPREVTHSSWFERLFKEQNNFSYGLMKVKDNRVKAALDALSGDGSEVTSSGKPGRNRGAFDSALPEGAAIQVLLNRYERNPAARARCIEYYGVKCTACGVALADRYGPDVGRLVHVHHLKPLASVKSPGTVDPVRDLRPVCPN